MILPRPHADLPELGEVARALTGLGEKLQASPAESLVDAVVQCAVDWVGGARWASVTTLQQGNFHTMGHTGAEAGAADALQYELRSGPCVDAVLDDSLMVSGDLAHDGRWPEYGPRAAREVGIASALSYRLKLIGDTDLIASLNLYSDAPDAFDEHAVWAGTMLATYAGLGISVAITHRRAANLEAALRTNREIGTAIGILMARHTVTRDQAQELLRLASQDTNRKMNEIAAEVVETGQLSLPRRPPSRTS